MARRLQRETETVRESRRRSDDDDDRGERVGRRPGTRSRDDDDLDDARRGRGSRRRRPPVQDEVGDLNRGLTFASIESAAIALDVAARVLRGAVDRAFDEDYERPGDVVRGVANEADVALYDLVSELRGVPRRLSSRFDDGLRSPRADQGERARRAERDGSTPADSPAADEGRSRRRLGRD